MPRAGFELQTLGTASSDGDHITMQLPNSNISLNFKFEQESGPSGKGEFWFQLGSHDPIHVDQGGSL